MNEWCDSLPLWSITFFKELAFVFHNQFLTKNRKILMPFSLWSEETKLLIDFIQRKPNICFCSNDVVVTAPHSLTNSDKVTWSSHTQYIPKRWWNYEVGQTHMCTKEALDLFKNYQCMPTKEKRKGLWISTLLDKLPWEALNICSNMPSLFETQVPCLLLISIGCIEDQSKLSSLVPTH